MVKKNKSKAFTLIELAAVILVIGMLIIGISKGIDIYKNYKTTMLQELTKKSRISRIENLEIWLESTLKESFLENEQTNNSTISIWNGINPNSVTKNNATPMDTNHRPSYKSDGINGLPAVYADGTDAMFVNNVTSSFADSGFTWIGVVKWESPYTAGKGSLGVKSEKFKSANYGVTLYIDNDNGGGNYIRVFSEAAGTMLSNYKGVAYRSSPNKEAHIITIVREKSKITSYFDGTLMTDISSGFVNGIYDSKSPWSIFYNNNDNTAAQYFKGWVGEYIVIGKPIGTKDVNEIHTYLSKKWGIKLL